MLLSKSSTPRSQFGVGFCSAYHITDVPPFVSRDRLYIFDPTLKHLKEAVKNQTRPGKKVKYLTKIIASSKQMEPYEGVFDFNSSTEYNGTIFRLPFRKSSSELSSELYSESTVKDLYKSIQQCGDKFLLFLQHVKCIRLHQMLDPDKGNSEIQNSSVPQPPSLDNATLRAVKTKTEAGELTNYWLIATHEKVEKNTAVANIACLLAGSEANYTVGDNLTGEVFCYLPLSQNSSLPVHVNCNFAVVTNRGGIWTSDSPNTDSNSDSEVQWNIYLMNKVAYVQ